MSHINALMRSCRKQRACATGCMSSFCLPLVGSLICARVPHPSSALFAELAPECASAYYRYGATLLYQAQDSADVFGAGVREAADDQAAGEAGGWRQKLPACGVRRVAQERLSWKLRTTLVVCSMQPLDTACASAQCPTAALPMRNALWPCPADDKENGGDKGKAPAASSAGEGEDEEEGEGDECELQCCAASAADRLCCTARAVPPWHVPACRLFASTCPLNAWRPSAAGAEGDLQLAWENLETAKVIWAKDADAHAQQLAGGLGSSSGGCRDGCRWMCRRVADWQHECVGVCTGHCTTVQLALRALHPVQPWSRFSPPRTPVCDPFHPQQMCTACWATSPWRATTLAPRWRSWTPAWHTSPSLCRWGTALLPSLCCMLCRADGQ